MTGDREQVAQLVDDVVTSFLGTSVAVAATSSEDRLHLAGCLQVSGAWSGSVVVACSRTFATTAAAAMFRGRRAGRGAGAAE